MAQNELISVIMPAYNAGRFIMDSIQSVIIQTYVHWELIIVDDESTDGTKSIIAELIKLDHRIKYIYQSSGKQGKARNTGIENAKGDFIAFLDADDLWIPEMLEKQMDFLKKNDADLVFSETKYIDEDSLLTGDKHYVLHNQYAGTSGIKEFLKGNCIHIITVLAKKNSIVAAGLFKESNKLQYGEDYDLWLRMLVCGANLVCHPEPLAYYRKHQQQSSKVTDSKYVQLLEIIKDLELDSIQKEKEEALYIWVRRSMRFTKPMSYTMIRTIINYIPSPSVRNFSLVASYLLPIYVLKKVVYKLTYLN